jgi:hypothetical protein
MPDLNTIFSGQLNLGDKISSLNISNSIKAGVDKVSSAVQGAFGSLPSLKITSKFEQKDLPKNTTNQVGTTPQQAKAKQSSFAGALQFPPSMKYYTKFSFYEYDKKVINVTNKDQPTKTIILPIPNDMHEDFAVEYETPALGPIIGAASESIINAFRNKDYGSLVPNNIADTLLVAGEAGILNQLKKGGLETAAAIGSMALGVAPNPNLAVLFSNIGLREHSFTYKFAPTSAAELATLKKIIQELKVRMLPGMDTKMLFTFPDVCDIEFGPTKDKPYKIKRCVMTSLKVNYTPMGSPAFFKTGDPVMVEISMSYKEMSPFTREDTNDSLNKDNQSQAETSRLANQPISETPRGE